MTPHENDCVKYLLSKHKTDGSERASYKNISIELLPYFREYFKSQGTKIRVRYRGPRNNPLDTRYRNQRMQDCVKRFANRFSIYFA